MSNQSMSLQICVALRRLRPKELSMTHWQCLSPQCRYFSLHQNQMISCSHHQQRSFDLRLKTKTTMSPANCLPMTSGEGWRNFKQTRVLQRLQFARNSRRRHQYRSPLHRSSLLLLHRLLRRLLRSQLRRNKSETLLNKCARWFSCLFM